MTPDQIIAWFSAIWRVFKRLFKKTRCLLIVEDDADDVEIISLFLRRNRRSYDVSRTAEDALTRIRSCKYEIIFLDIRLPCMDGWMLLSHIIDESPESKIIITCGDPRDLVKMPVGIPFEVMIKPPSMHGIDKILK